MGDGTVNLKLPPTSCYSLPSSRLRPRPTKLGFSGACAAGAHLLCGDRGGHHAVHARAADRGHHLAVTERQIHHLVVPLLKQHGAGGRIPSVGVAACAGRGEDGGDTVVGGCALRHCGYGRRRRALRALRDTTPGSRRRWRQFASWPKEHQSVHGILGV